MGSTERRALLDRIGSLPLSAFLPLVREFEYGVALVALDGRFLWCNHAYETLIGYSEAELFKMRWQDVTPDHTEREADALQVQRVKEGDLLKYEMDKHYRKKNAQIVPVHLLVQRLVSPEGEFLLFVSGVRELPDIDPKFLTTSKTSFYKRPAVKATLLDIAAGNKKLAMIVVICAIAQLGDVIDLLETVIRTLGLSELLKLVAG